MAKTPSNMIPLGTKAPDFSLIDTITGKVISLKEIKSNVATVIMFICNHCPFVKHIQPKLVDIATQYGKKGIQFIAISSNDIQAYPDDAPDKMREEAISNHYPFPYLYDETQSVAKAYNAACTPDFYVFDNELKCVYRGRFDDSTPGNNQPITGRDLSTAFDAIINKAPIPDPQLPSVGCNIKWTNKK